MSASWSRTRVLVLGLLLALLAVRVAATAIAEYLAPTRPQQALAIRAGQPEALLGAASARGEAGDPASARDLARRALAANPLDGRGFRELARVDEDPVHQRRLMELAVSGAPRDLASRTWLLQRDVAEARHADALQQIDAVLRLRPELIKPLLPALASVVADALTRSALADVLARAPAWRPAFWSRLCGLDGVPVEAIAALARTLDGGATPLAPAERSAWLERLIRDRRWSQAYPLWVSMLPPERRVHLTNVHDGSFEFAAENGGFGWRIARVPGAEVSLRGAAGARALRVEFADRRVPFRHVRQLLALSPGSWRLHGRVRADALRNERGLQWTVRCAESGERIAATDRYAGSSPWREFTIDFSVPEFACGAQWLQLELAARVPGEQQVSGRIEFADLRIIRTAGAASARQ